MWSFKQWGTPFKKGDILWKGSKDSMVAVRETTLKKEGSYMTSYNRF